MKRAESLRELAFVSAFISIVDDRRVIIENVKRIIECNEISSCVEASGFNVTVWGSELRLSNYDTGSIEVSGIISSVELNRVSAKGRDI